MSAATRQKDAEMAKHLSPAPKVWRSKPWEWPYHNNLGSKKKPRKA